MKIFYLSAVLICVHYNTAQGQVILKPNSAIFNSDIQGKSYRYKDIISGELLELHYDPSNGCMYNTVTGKNADFFINTTTGDTVAGKGFYIVNRYLQKHDGVYGIDRSKINFKGKRMWDIKLNKELKADKGYVQFYKTKSRETALNESL